MRSSCKRSWWHATAGLIIAAMGRFRAAVLIAPEAPFRTFSRLAPAQPQLLTNPHAGKAAPIGFGVAGVRAKLPAALRLGNGSGTINLRPAGLILPWSSGAGPQNVFSLAPLVAAAWAQSGYSTPIASESAPVGVLRFAWPALQGKLGLAVERDPGYSGG